MSLVKPNKDVLNIASIAEEIIETSALEDNFYTETEIDANIYDKTEVYSKAELDAGQLDNRYYTETESDAKYNPIIPVGTIFPSGRPTAPTGYLLCDGSAISRTTYSALFSAISTSFGAGNGSTTFNLPNAKGVTLKGAGDQLINGRMKSAGALGTVLEDQIQGHWHRAYIGLASGAGNTIGSDDNAPGYSTTDTGIRESISDGTNGTPRTGTVTRDSSLAVNYIIKY